MHTGKVKEFIKKLRAPKLTEEEINIIKAHHEYHGDKDINILGTLPHGGVFVRVKDHFGFHDSVIDSFRYRNDCGEDFFIREAGDGREIRLIKRWLKEVSTKDELKKLKDEGLL